MSGFHPRRDWLLIPATLVMLTLLVFLAAHFFYDHGNAVVYWLILLYDYTYFDFRILAGILIVVFLLLLAGWRSADLFSGNFKRPLVATTLSLATFAMFLAATVAVVTQRNRFASTPAGGAISAHGRLYRLAYRPTDGSYYTFVLFECDGSGIVCHPRDESCVDTTTEPNLRGAPRGRLILDPTNRAVSIQIDGHPGDTCVPGA